MTITDIVDAAHAAARHVDHDRHTSPLDTPWPVIDPDADPIYRELLADPSHHDAAHHLTATEDVQ